MSARPAAARFDAHYQPVPEAGCWLWTGFCSPLGYGRLSISNRPYPAHRFAWELFRGPIPAGMCVCHKCDTRCCVNPEHLYLGTQTENMRDMAVRGRSTFGARNPNAKLSERDVRDILADSRPQYQIAAHYGVSLSRVSELKSRKSWRHL